MKFLADECCDLSTVTFLRNEGHDVAYMPEIEPGISDSDVLSKAFDEKRILITEDKDFGTLVYRLKKPARGIILLRFHPKDHDSKLSQIKKLTDRFSSKLSGNFIVADSKKVRIRPLIRE